MPYNINVVSIKEPVASYLFRPTFMIEDFPLNR